MKKLLLLLMVVLAATLPGWAALVPDSTDEATGADTYKFQWKDDANHYGLPSNANWTSFDAGDTGIMVTNVKGIYFYAMGMNGGVMATDVGDSFTLTAPAGYTISAVAMTTYNTTTNVNNSSYWSISGEGTGVVTVTAVKTGSYSLCMWVTLLPSADVKVANVSWAEEGYGEMNDGYQVAVNLDWNKFYSLPAIQAHDKDSGDLITGAKIEFSVEGNLQIVKEDDVEKITGYYPLTTTYYDYVEAKISATWSHPDYGKSTLLTQRVHVMAPASSEKLAVTLEWVDAPEEWNIKYDETNLTVPQVKAALADGTDVTDMGTISYSSPSGKFYVEDGKLVANVFQFGEGDLEVKWTPKSAWTVPDDVKLSGANYPETLNCQNYYESASLTQAVNVEKTLQELTVWFTDAEGNLVDGNEFEVNLTEGIKNVPVTMPIVKGYNDVTLTAPYAGTFTFSASDLYSEEDPAPVEVNYDAEKGTLTLSASATAEAEDAGIVYVTFTPTGNYADMYNVVETAFAVNITEKTISNAPTVTFTPDYGDNGYEGDENAQLFLNSVKIEITEYEEGGSTWYTLDGSDPEYEGANSFKFTPTTVEPEEGDENAEATVDNSLTLYQKDALVKTEFNGEEQTELVFKVASFNAEGEKPSEIQEYRAFFLAPTAFYDLENMENADPKTAMNFNDMFDAVMVVVPPYGLFNEENNSLSLKYRLIGEGETEDDAQVYTADEIYTINISNKKAGEFTVKAWFAKGRVNGSGVISQLVNVAEPEAPSAPVFSLSLAEGEEVAEVEDGQTMEIVLDVENPDNYTIRYTTDGTEPTAENGQTYYGPISFRYDSTDLDKNEYTVKAVAYVSGYTKAISEVTELPVKVLKFDQVLNITFDNDDWDKITTENFINYVVSNPTGLVTAATAEYDGKAVDFGQQFTLYGTDLTIDSSSGQTAALTLTLDKELKAARIVVNVEQNNSNNVTTFDVNGTEVEIGTGIEGFKNYTIDVESGAIENIVISTTNQSMIRVKSISVYNRGDIAGVPTITVDEETNEVTIVNGKNGVSSYYSVFANRPYTSELGTAEWTKYEAPFTVENGGYVYAYSVSAADLKSDYVNELVRTTLNAGLILDAEYYDMTNPNVNKYSTEAMIPVYLTDPANDNEHRSIALNNAQIVLTDKDGNELTDNTIWSSTDNAGTFWLEVREAGQYKVKATWDESGIYKAGESTELAAYLNIYAPVAQGSNVEVVTVNGVEVNYIVAPEAQDGFTMVTLEQEDGVELYYAVVKTDGKTEAFGIKAFAAATGLTFEDVNANPGFMDEDNNDWTQTENGEIYLPGQNGAFIAVTKKNGIVSPTSLYYYGTEENKNSDFTTGIFGVNAAEEGAEYYDLNGYRVSGNELKAGIYVKVVNGNATKVVVK